MDNLDGILPLVHDIWGACVRCERCNGWLQHFETRRVPCATCAGMPCYLLRKLPPPPSLTQTEMPTVVRHEEITFNSYTIKYAGLTFKAWFHVQ